jgi:leader peptidase (prepilin peptidase) / N-methyltransferase
VPAALYAVLVAVFVGVLCAGGPALIRRIPEPEPDPEEEAELEADHAAGRAVPDPKTLYAEVAARPGLARDLAIAGVVVGAIVGWLLAGQPILLAWAYLAPVGVILGYIDWRTRLLPTAIIKPSYGVVIVLTLVAGLIDGSRDGLIRSVWGFAVMGFLYWFLWRVYSRGMGFGDVRLSGLLGIALGYVGWGVLLTGLYAGFLVGGIGGLLLAVLKIVDRKRFAFGPFMLIGCLVGLAWGAPCADWYVNR